MINCRLPYLNLLVAEVVGVIYPGLLGVASGVAKTASVEFNLASCTAKLPKVNQ